VTKISPTLNPQFISSVGLSYAVTWEGANATTGFTEFLGGRFVAPRKNTGHPINYGANLFSSINQVHTSIGDIKFVYIKKRVSHIFTYCWNEKFYRSKLEKFREILHII